MLKQSLHQKLQQKLSPQQIQLMNLVQLPTLAFEERVIQELEENPALEECYDPKEENLEEPFDTPFEEEGQSIDTSEINIDEYLSDDEIPAYRTYINHQIDEEERSMPMVSRLSFHEYLKDQLHTFRLSDEDFLIADFILGNLDGDGYLRRDIHVLVDDMAITLGIMTTVVKVEELLIHYIQKLDPPGVGARNLQECLCIQLKTKPPTGVIILAQKVIQEAFDTFSKKHYPKLQERFGFTERQLKEIVRQIERLDPKPGRLYSGNNIDSEQIIPDFTVRIVDGDLELSLNSRNMPELNVSPSYTEMFEAYKHSKEKSENQRNTVLFIKQKLDSAKWFIDALKQREHTLMLTMNAIMDYQREYFLSGDEHKIRPMILKDIAEKIGMDISTVSRVASSKYVNTPYGTFLIKDLFSEAMINEDGEEISTIEIKKILAESIIQEDKRIPLTDEKLGELLKKKGYIMARRTVAKYREQLNIPVARLRRTL
ncbi:MAG: RNA polymerase factor sigma-54 [Flavobacteriales bacterium AspAUS03]